MVRFTVPLLVLASLPCWAQVSSTARIAGLMTPPRLTQEKLLGDTGAAPPGLSSEATQVQRRWWFSRGGADLGVGLGTIAYGFRPTGSLPGLVGPDGMAVAASATVLTLGMRYRTSDHSALFADASDWHGAAIQGNDALVGKFGLELKSAQSFLNISYGGLGMRLASDTRLMVRPRHGGLGVVMRHGF